MCLLPMRIILIVFMWNNDSEVYWCNHLDSDSLVEKTFLSSAISFFTGFVTGFVVGICTLNPVAGAIAGVAAGAATSVAGGAYISWYVGQHNYDPDYQAWKTYSIIIGLSVVSGIMGGITGGYIGAGIAASVTSQMDLLYAEILSDTTTVVYDNQMPANAYLFTVL